MPLWKDSAVNTNDFVSKTIDETITGRKTFQPPTTTTGHSVSITRDANYLGGTRGYVNSGLCVWDVVRDGVTAFEWSLLGVMRNYANAGENVGVYGQGWKYASGPTWAGCFEARDMTDNDASIAGGALLGLEVDIFANGSDTSAGSRIGIDLVAGSGTSGGVQAEIHAGIRMGTQDGNSSYARFRRGIDFQQTVETGLYFGSSGNVGIDFSNGNYPTALKLKSDSYIELGGSAKMKYNASANYIEFYNGSTRVGYINMGGTDHAL